MIARDFAATVPQARPVLAWGVSVICGAVLGVVLWRYESGSGNVWFAIPITIVVGGFSAPFAAVGVWIARRFHLQRPLADSVGGALIATLTFLPFAAFGPPISIIAAAGACAGLCYWLALRARLPIEIIRRQTHAHAGLRGRGAVERDAI